MMWLQYAFRAHDLFLKHNIHIYCTIQFKKKVLIELMLTRNQTNPKDIFLVG